MQAHFGYIAIVTDQPQALADYYAKYFDMCVRHIQFMLRLNLRPDGLHRHSPLSQAAWGRGNGFPALGLALSLSALPADHRLAHYPEWTSRRRTAGRKAPRGFRPEPGLAARVGQGPRRTQPGASDSRACCSGSMETTLSSRPMASD